NKLVVNMKRKMGYSGTLVLFLILTILVPTKLAEFTGEGSPVQDLNSPPPPPGRLLKRQPPPIAPVQIDIPRHRLRPPPIDLSQNDGTAYAP
ncbi:hypothetical protein VIGAN_08302900, partial [Vigna angularis var. angularis]